MQSTPKGLERHLHSVSDRLTSCRNGSALRLGSRRRLLLWGIWIEFIEVVDPVGTESRSVTDELAPYRASQPVIDSNVPDRIDRNHAVSFL